MSTSEISSKLETLREYETLAAEAAAIADSIRDEIKKHMDSIGAEELSVGTCIIRYTSVISNKFDSTAFRKVMPDLYKAYTKPVSSRRFTISR